jgi:hypothetical protein
MGQRLALIVGSSEYQDTTLARLKKSEADVESLAEILKNPEIGDFEEVITLINDPSYVVRLEIARFFAQKRRDDLLLLYFSGHGVKDDLGRLYLALKDTQHNLLSATAVSAASISDEMDRCRSQRLVLILDCCHSGAFAQGIKGATQVSVGTGEAFRGNGYGRVVLSATDSTQYAWEGDEVIGEAENSVYTHYLIQGLRTGEADTNSDGEITTDELHNYVYEQVVQKTPKQTPVKSSHNEQRDIIIARNPDLRPADLPLGVRHAIESDFFQERQSAVIELAKLLGGGHRGLALAAQQALENMAQHDDSRRISNLAHETLQAYHETMSSTQQPATDLPGMERESASQGARAEQPVVAAEPTQLTDKLQRQIQEERRLEEERKQELIRNLYETGMQAMETRDWKKSISTFQQVLDLNSEYLEAAYYLDLAKEEQRKAEVTTQDSSHRPATEVINSSGRGKEAIVPEEIKEWNWGAFLLNGFWGLGNSTYIGLLSFVPFTWTILDISFWITLIPVFVISVMLGFKGNEWAWRNKRWENIEHFQRVQRKWMQVGVLVIIATIVSLVSLVLLVPHSIKVLL